MGGTLTFPIDDAFKAMVKGAKTLHLVKDQGVYLMKFGKTPKSNVVVYAKGFDPNKVDFDEWYNKAHSVCGGDDFGESIDAKFFANAIAKGARVVKIKLTATRMSIEASR
jgi:hypothetical protein